jgi:hypothetical protein
MDNLEHALELASLIRDHVQAELMAAREQRILVRKLDVQGLFERARVRGVFNVKLAQLQGALGEAMAAVASERGWERLSIEFLQAAGDDPALALAGALGEMRASAQALREIDSLNQVLARRALACVRGYISALSPRADAYDRHGGARAGAEISIARQVA